MDRPGIPICVVTGFLGAGKTTFLNHILRNSDGLRTAVFVNEFGKTEIDSTLIRMSGCIDEDRVVTLDNGCICCEINEDLAMQLRSVLEARAGSIDYVVIETSGVCDPTPVLTTLERLESLAFRTHLDCVVAVIDAASIVPATGDVAPVEAGRLGLEETARAQICSSDLVLLNKCDLLQGGLEGEMLQCVQATLTQKLRLAASQLVRRPPRIISTVNALVDLALVTSLPSSGAVQQSQLEKSGDETLSPTEERSEDLDTTKRRRIHAPGDARVIGSSTSHSAASLRTTARSFQYESARPFDPLRFEEWIDKGGPPQSICRAKGLLWMRGVPLPVIFQLAGSRTNPFETVSSAKAGPPTGSRIIFIGEAKALQNGDEDAVRAALDACLVAP